VDDRNSNNSCSPYYQLAEDSPDSLMIPDMVISYSGDAKNTFERNQVEEIPLSRNFNN
jgi:tryptophan synthase alpha subunit